MFESRIIVGLQYNVMVGDASEVEDGWCCPPKPLDIDTDSPEDLPPPPPSPPPKRMQSLNAAFSYRVLERKFGDAKAPRAESPAKTQVQPKKVSKFKASKMKK
nr:uncharacterized protein LOC123753572 [Procambarus clarkii]